MMGLKRCYKVEGFYIYICSFYTVFYAIRYISTIYISDIYRANPGYFYYIQSFKKAETYLHATF